MQFLRLPVYIVLGELENFKLFTLPSSRAFIYQLLTFHIGIYGSKDGSKDTYNFLPNSKM